MLGPIWYLEIFVCLDFNPLYNLYLHVYVALSYL
jgi:hypothetical protein